MILLLIYRQKHLCNRFTYHVGKNNYQNGNWVFLANSWPEYILTHSSDMKGHSDTIWGISKTQVEYQEVIWPRFGEKTVKNHAFLRSNSILKFHKFIDFFLISALMTPYTSILAKIMFRITKNFFMTKHQRFQFWPPLCHKIIKMCFGQVLAKALLCKIVKFCQLIQYTTYSDIRKRTRFFSWPSAQKHPRKLSSGPEDVLADAQEHLLLEK